jgi:glycosyltransferase involved in cell wall biosynthesis
VRILLVHDYDKPIGGAETVLVQTRDGLRRAGHSVAILAGKSSAAGQSFADYSFSCPDQSVIGKLIFHLYNPGAKRAMKRAIRDFRPDLIHYHTINRLSVAGIWASVQSVMTMHDYGLVSPLLNKVLPKDEFCGLSDGACCVKHAGLMRYWFERLRTSLIFSRRGSISVFLAPSKFMKGAIEGLGYSPVRVIANPLTKPIGRGLVTASKSGATLMYAGRLEQEKGIRSLLQAFKLIHDRLPEAKLVIAGEGPEKEYVEHFVEDNKLRGSVQLLGFVTKEALFTRYAAAKLVIIPSLWPEPFGLIGIEAFSTGTPVVASGRGGMDWLVDGDNGLEVNPEKPDEMAQAVISLLLDEARYSQMVQNALKTAQDYAPEAYTKNLLRAYALAGAATSRVR